MGIGDLFQDGIDAAAAASERFLREAGLKTEIGSLKEEQSRLFRELGSTAFDLIRDGEVTHPRLTETSDRLAGIEARIRRAEEESVSVRRAAVQSAHPDCPACGASHPSGAKFCPACGRAVRAASASACADSISGNVDAAPEWDHPAAAPAPGVDPSPVGTVACVKCGTPLASGAQFCRQCGTLFKSEAPSD